MVCFCVCKVHAWSPCCYAQILTAGLGFGFCRTYLWQVPTDIVSICLMKFNSLGLEPYLSRVIWLLVMAIEAFRASSDGQANAQTGRQKQEGEGCCTNRFTLVEHENAVC
jgi:hypothetical protein